MQFRRRVGNVHDQPIIRLWQESAALARVRAAAADAYELARGTG